MKDYPLGGQSVSFPKHLRINVSPFNTKNDSTFNIPHTMGMSPVLPTYVVICLDLNFFILY